MEQEIKKQEILYQEEDSAPYNEIRDHQDSVMHVEVELGHLKVVDGIRARCLTTTS